MNRKEIEMQIQFLGEQLNRNLELSMWAPGDGWTRYQVLDKDTGRGIFGSHRVFNKRELEAALLASREVVYLVGEKS